MSVMKQSIIGCPRIDRNIALSCYSKILIVSFPNCFDFTNKDQQNTKVTRDLTWFGCFLIFIYITLTIQRILPRITKQMYHVLQKKYRLTLSAFGKRNIQQAQTLQRPKRQALINSNFANVEKGVYYLMHWKTSF